MPAPPILVFEGRDIDSVVAVGCWEPGPSRAERWVVADVAAADLPAWRQAWADAARGGGPVEIVVGIRLDGEGGMTVPYRVRGGPRPGPPGGWWGLGLASSGATEATERRPSTAPGEAAARRAGPPPLRILLVEDDPITRDLTARLLRRSGHQVATADNVASARATAEAAAFDLVVSDLGLPDGSGLDLMPWLHERFGLPGIAVTAFGPEYDHERSRSAGFAAHLTKPLEFPALESAIRRVAAEARRAC